MARPLRIEYAGAYYHVMNRGNRRQVVFAEPQDYELFLERLGFTRMYGPRKVDAILRVKSELHRRI